MPQKSCSFFSMRWWSSLRRHARQNGSRQSLAVRLRLEELEARLTPSNLITLASFNGTDGGGNKAALIMDQEGNLYGTTQQGGPAGDGNVFEVAQGSGTVTNLASFNGANGQEPVSGLSMDASENLYGTAFLGGANDDGTVYEIKRGSGTITTLASFNGTDGANPEGNPIFDDSGNIYGTTAYGGPDGIGTVFELSPATGTITTLAWFNGADGSYPRDSLLMDSKGNLYGTTKTGGPDNDGTVFEVAKGSGTVTTLADFDGTNGALSPGALVMDASGNLYGVTQAGGPNSDGTVFEVAKGSGIATVLAYFDGANGATPGYESLFMDSHGNLYGTTLGGGAQGVGTVFEVAKGSGTITTLASFSSGDGAAPGSGLIADGSGNLYSTTVNAGAGNNGTVFELQPATTTSVVSSANPSAYGQTVTFTATVTANSPATAAPSGTLTFCSAGPQLSDSGFELPALSPGTFQYNPSGSPWTFAGGSGVSSNGGGFTSANPSAPQGNQVAFLQGGDANVSQTVTFQAGTYVINFEAAQRGNNPVPPSDQTFNVTIDGKVISSFNSLLGTEYTNLTTSAFQVTAGSHQIAFVGTDSNGGDNTVLLDQVNVLKQLDTGTLNTNGQANFSTSAMAMGEDLVTAIYSGDTNFPGSMGTLTLTNVPNFEVTTLLDSGNPSGTTSLRQAITAAEAKSGPQTIGFASSILTQASGNIIDLESALPALKGNITIDGPGASVLTIQRDPKASSAFRVFAVNSGATANISNLTISGGSVSTSGGGIYNAGSLTIDDCTVSGNTASRGGGLANIGGTVQISNTSTFSSNTAQNGGGIFDASGTLTINSSTLSNNSATNYGGGISNAGTAMIAATTLSGNTTRYGGGIYNAGTLTVSKDTVKNNTVTVDGGGLANIGGTVTVSDSSTFSGNKAPDGGGIYDGSGTLSIIASTLSNNSATNYGGGISIGHATATITGTTVSDNSSNIGGGIYNVGTLKLNKGSVTSNSATTSGGGLCNFSGVVTVSNSSLLSGNTASIGGGIYTHSGTVTVTDSAVQNNTVSAQGGGLTNVGGTVAVNNSSTFSGNSSKNGGGIINYTGGKVTISASTLSNNSATNFGGGFSNSGTAMIANATLSGNSSQTGGGIYNVGTMMIGSNKLSTNTASQNGGGIYNGKGAKAMVSNATITSNSAGASYHGGGIYSLQGALTLKGSNKITNNTPDNTYT